MYSSAECKAQRSRSGPLRVSLLCLFCLVSSWPHTLALSDPAVPPAFVDVSREAQLSYRHVSGTLPIRHIAETMGSGGGFLDYDNDGWQDVYLVNGGTRPGIRVAISAKNQLFRNHRDGTFTDVTTAVGVGDPSYGMGCAFADYDNDGFVDIYVTNLGPNVMYHNNGDGTFTDVTQKAGLGDPLWSTSAAFGDYDGDGYLDLYVCNYLKVPFAVSSAITCPYSYNGVPNTLYRNRGDGTFEEATAQARVREDSSYSKSLGVIWLDADNDGDLDLYVANDTTANFLFENRGDGTFEDISLVSGTAFGESGAPQAGMGVDAADLNGNGLFNIFVTNYSLQHNALYWNEGSGIFIDRVVDSRLAGPSYLPLGFGANFFDYDNDGFVDLFVGNGHVLENTKEVSPSTAYRQLNQLFRHLGQGRFVEVSSQAGAYFSRKNVRRGSATGDFNNDGKVDLLVTNNNDGADLLENRTAGANHWLKLKLEGTHCNRDAVGAKVTLTAGNYRRTQEVRAGNSYLSQSDLRLHFGVGNRTSIDSLQVSWPCGKKQRLAPIKELDQIIRIQEK